MALANLLDGKVQGALLWSRILNFTEMDSPSRFCFGLEKHEQNKVIRSLFSATGQELLELGQIREWAVEFFSSLYSNEYGENEALLEEFCGEGVRVKVRVRSLQI